jgi:hypothetical protein
MKCLHTLCRPVPDKSMESIIRTLTLLSPHDLAERDVAQLLELEFGAAWSPEYHRCSIDTEDAFVAVDFDPQYIARLRSDEQRTLTAQVGFTPKSALHVQSSGYHVGSPALAEQVLQTLRRHFDGQTLTAA